MVLPIATPLARIVVVSVLLSLGFPIKISPTIILFVVVLIILVLSLIALKVSSNGLLIPYMDT